MAPGSRLEELTARYMQDPRRYFVPLANEYRKTQELDRAIALCREHLPSQPGHMSGHIVLARAYFDKGDLLAAREVFATSVELDDENLIALRHLGDIALSRAEMAEAHLWYSRVLDADPQNGEVESLLRSLDAPAAVTTVDLTPRDRGTVTPDTIQTSAPAVQPGPLREPAPVAAHPRAPFDLSTPIGVDREMAAVELPEASGVAQWLEGDAQPDATIDFADAPAAVELYHAGDASGAIVGFGFSFDELDTLAEPLVLGPLADENDVMSLAGLDLPNDAFASLLLASPDEPTVAAPQADELLSPPGFSALASFASWRTAQARDTPSSLPVQPSSLPVQPTPPATVSPLAEPDAAPVFRMPFLDEPDSWEDEPSLSAGAPAPEFMTETMAVLYEQQGYMQQALDIYLALQRRAPKNAVIAGKIADLQLTLASCTSQESLQADADKALQFQDLNDVGSFGSAGDSSPFPPAPLLADDTLDDAFASAWSAAPAAAAADAVDDWFADESDSELNADLNVDVFTVSDGMFGIAIGGFTAPDPARDADSTATGAPAPDPVVALAAVFGSAEIGASDAAAAETLSALAAQMVGRLPKDAPTLPVPDVLELPASPAVDSARGATPAPLLSFDRFFSGIGSAPRVRVDTPLTANRSSAPPAHVWPSLSPTFGGLPVVPLPGSDSAAAWASFDPFAPAAEAGTFQVDPRVGGPASSVPASTFPGTSTPSAPSAPARDQISSPPSHDQAQAAAQPLLDTTAATSGEPPPVSAEPESPRRPSSDFHRWLEGLS